MLIVTTTVTMEGGVTACLESDDRETLWTPDYRIGLAYGLLFDRDERPPCTTSQSGTP